MAYEGGYGGGGYGGGGRGSPYGGQQMNSRPGPPGNRPPPRGYDRGPPPPQPYHEHGDAYGHSGYDAARAQGYDDSYQDGAYERAPPPPQQGHYGPGPARGAPMNYPPDGRRPGPPPQRGGYGGPGPRGGMRNDGGPGQPGQYNGNQDPMYSNQPPPNQQPLSPRQAGFDHGPGGFPGHPNQDRWDHEQQMIGQMSNMDLNGPGPRGPPARANTEIRGNYGASAPPQMNGNRPPPTRQYPPQEYAGNGPGQSAGGYDNYGGDFDSGPRSPQHEFAPPTRSATMPINNFGPPSRSATMPVNNFGPRPNMVPQRTDPGPYPQPSGRGMPQRPSTAAGNRPPPQRMYPSDPQMPPQDSYQGGYGDPQQSRSSIDDVYDAYQEHRMSNPEFSNSAFRGQNGRGSFDATPSHLGHNGYDEGPSHHVDTQPRNGPRHMPMLNHTKSQPDLRQPQAAVFDMTGDIPAVPPMPRIQPYKPGAEQEPIGSLAGYDNIPRGPSAPPGANRGSRGSLPDHPAVMRPGPTPAPNRNPDGLPAHPMPVRPGLMANSMVNTNDKPPPVRNYGGIPQSATPRPMQPPQQPPPQQQQAIPQPRAPPPQESPVTPQELEHLRMVVKGNPGDQTTALKLAKRLVEAADTLVPNLPDPKARHRARDRYLVDAHKILKKLANAQNIEAMFFMADSVGRGLFSHEPDHKEAFTLYQSAAKLGHPAAAYRTAVCCEIGHEEGGGTRRDPLKAMQWYKRAATLGDPPAMYKMGMIQLKGLLGQPRNPREAVGWLKRAAERADAENPHALHELGLLYEAAQPNDAIVRDEAYALSLFQQAAALGYKFSQYRLGATFEYGLMGCPVDPKQSIMWYSRAATQEEHQSELALSGWYLTGVEGVLGQSDTEAYLWARKAAIARLAKAEYAMGYFTEVGIGTAANLEDAKRWYWRAAAQDFPQARERLEDLKRTGGRSQGPRQRERISRSRMDKQQEGDCTVM